MSFKGKVVIVTGSSTGIGASIATEFAKEGAQVTVVGRNEKKLANVSESIEKIGSKPLVIQADVSKTDDANRIISDTVKRFGKIDILVNNAGIAKTALFSADNLMEVYDEIMNINLRAAVSLSHLAAPYLIETKGNIVNISSICAKMILRVPGILPYSISKSGMDHFTRCLAKELAPSGVRVNSLNVGPVKTEILGTDAAADECWENLKNDTALKRLSEPEEIAYVVLFLANEKAKGITGADVITDNGSLLC